MLQNYHITNLQYIKQNKHKFYAINILQRFRFLEQVILKKQKQIKEIQPCSRLQLQKSYTLPLVRYFQESYQPSKRQLSRTKKLVQVQNQLRLSEDATQCDNP
ncbi:Hypothetical_protein [Hexamita inflata]|uniref:Hypothetical_protein n=1 Tax=Hexamita inflata TaxID=28002 RepID=A0AA86UY57_9EUKA|nr:Hypothetical protein HINF_LOCUS60328 [Hexamita inflata]CAI9972684.1 Hypothetical protein HINF_LOCUS60329 [Hexamita inflata]CAI9972685.1 Hypothetical protein HINF_LOCUS60330 [Hexamita inflata]